MNGNKERMEYTIMFAFQIFSFTIETKIYKYLSIRAHIGTSKLKFPLNNPFAIKIIKPYFG